MLFWVNQDLDDNLILFYQYLQQSFKTCDLIQQ